MKTKAVASIMMLLFLANMLVVAIPIETTYACYLRRRHRKTFVVRPSGGDDTANIQDAFDAAVATGPRSTVQLTAGRFYCNNIFVENFHGTFRGAGKDVTIIDTLRGWDPALPGLTHTGLGVYLFFFGFDGGDIKISDMTFDITAEEPAKLWEWPWEPYENRYDVGNIVRIMGDANSAFERVGFRGHEGTYNETLNGNYYNVELAIVISDPQIYNPETDWVTCEPITGRHTVSRCSFEYVDESIDVACLVDGTVRIGGSPRKGNFIDGGALPLIFWDLSNSKLELSYNEIHAEGLIGMWISGGELSPCLPSKFFIHHNDIYVNGMTEVMWLMDFGVLSGADKTLNIVVFRNNIVLDTELGGIWGYGTDDVMVIHNKITGTGMAGIYMGVTGDPGDLCTGWKIIGNNVKDLDADEAHIWLGPDTRDCLVVGRKSTIVLDEGEDNILVGVTEK